MRRVWAALACLGLVASLLLSVVRNLVVTERLLAIGSSLASYAVVGYLFALVVFFCLLERRPASRWLSAGVVVALAGLVLHAVWLRPLFSGGVAGTRTDLVVMNSNLEFGEGDPRAVVAAVREQRVDVLVMEEVTPSAVAGLRRAGLDDVLPRVAGAPDPNAAGTMVYSRYGLVGAERLDVSNGGLAVTVEAPTAFRLLAAHPSQPLIAPHTWADDLGHLREAAAGAVRRGPTLVVGDLNSTWDNRLFRDLLGAGLRDSDEAADSGWQPTWPSMQVVPVPRVLTLDHVLASDRFAAVSTDTFLVPRSDHRALVARLEVRPAG